MMLQFKLDENMDPRWGNALQEAGNSVSSVADQQLQETDDRTLAEVCREQQDADATGITLHGEVLPRKRDVKRRSLGRVSKSLSSYP